ncbi:MAG: ABC transporter permease [Oscillospiraceae bacterium]|jgi:putative ABC transport system permease protein|nr:ABC transporter permease [Oscillospiraceae bacterium]
MRVSNNATIRRLTLRSLKANKLRNIVAVIAIALTAVLFTAIFTLGGNMLETVQNSTMRQVGTSAHAGAKLVTQEQYDRIAAAPSVRDISYNIIIGLAENDALKKSQTELRYSENTSAKWGFSYPEVGSMPQKETEIACSTITLDLLGIPHEIGASVPLEHSVNGKKYTETFTLCGYWTGDPVMAAQQAWVSREYCDKVAPMPTISLSQTDGVNLAGYICADIWFSNSLNIEGKVAKLQKEAGFAPGEVNIGVNWAYVGNEIDPTTAIIAVFVLLLVLLSGYLIIYSIFTISVTADIHFFGLLKTIGTTGLQLRKIVAGQALLLSAIGIPLGLLIGCGVGFGLTPFILNIMGGNLTISPTVNPIIFMFSAVFSLLTVFISCRKPARIAAKVSPVEAVRYADAPISKSGKSKRTKVVSPLTMADANVTRGKRKLITVVLSLSLSMILLNSVFSAVNGFDMEKYLSNSIVSDFAIADSSIFTNGSAKKLDGVTPKMLQLLTSSGAEISNVYCRDVYKWNESGTIPTETKQIYGIGSSELALFSEVDYEKLRSENVCIVSKQVFGVGPTVAIPKVGDIITLTNESGATEAFEVVELVEEYPYQISERYYLGDSLTVIISNEAFLNLFGETQPMQTNVNVEDKLVPEVEKLLSDYAKNIDTALGYISRSTLMAEFDGLRKTYVAIGGALSFILALIGILNFTNSQVTSIFARRRELAILQSIGMTGKQTKKMLFCEGLLHAILTILFTLTVGLGIGYLIMQVIAGQVWFFDSRFTLAPSLYCIPPLLLICAAVPFVCYNRLARESVVERLRIE